MHPQDGATELYLEQCRKGEKLKRCGYEEGNLTQGEKNSKDARLYSRRKNGHQISDKNKWSLIAVNKTFIKGISRKYN